MPLQVDGSSGVEHAPDHPESFFRGKLDQPSIALLVEAACAGAPREPAVAAMGSVMVGQTKVEQLPLPQPRASIEAALGTLIEDGASSVALSRARERTRRVSCRAVVSSMDHLRLGSWLVGGFQAYRGCEMAIEKGAKLIVTPFA